ncbi:mannose-1-phosphate guanylyltransferase/mannose-6-phosphate isomerase [Pseudohongiella nitratireducens]|uniref:mannose-1-phosphate guanylyltransferase/mannose-6-phosphate isomerase n=1 Tax=Pseudohongiella nitratireducens TaxID=1768907 RepID=UPI0030EBB121|tara:strand:- start:1036 stop:2466 length:1431 start_codon:yes stop_codon:yes gene_type:complete
MSSVIPVILSGGSGTRLWPLSRKHYPKQFHKLSGSGHTLIQDTALRVKHLAPPIVVCNEDHRFMLADQLQQVGITPATILLEPEAKNTAPAIALAALKALEIDPEAVIAVFPADHVIADNEQFQLTMAAALEAAQSGEALLTFGIVPTHAETGYGYIECEDSDSSKQSTSASPVKQFVEKPDLATAESYLASGKHFWNSGMFVFRASTFMDELNRHNEAIVRHCTAAFELAEKDLDFIRIDQAAFAECPSDSIDYAVMEKSDKVQVMPLNAGWSDIGGWSAIWDILDKDAQGTASVGDVINIDTINTLVHSNSKDKLVCTIGLEDIVIVDTPNALLVSHKDRVQDVKKAVSQIADDDRQEHLYHREVHRPWGSYDSIDFGNRYQVKRITVKPGASLSLQKHHHRAEHWIVVTGTAEVQVGEKISVISENQSVYIPLGEIHRLTNPGKVPLELIEVQSGSYLGEDDIVRLQDNFGRS